MDSFTNAWSSFAADMLDGKIISNTGEPFGSKARRTYLANGNAPYRLNPGLPFPPPDPTTEPDELRSLCQTLPNKSHRTPQASFVAFATWYHANAFQLREDPASSESDDSIEEDTYVQKKAKKRNGQLRAKWMDRLYADQKGMCANENCKLRMHAFGVQFEKEEMQVDHIDCDKPKMQEKRNDLQLLCGSCHSKKSIQEQRAAKRKRA